MKKPLSLFLMAYSVLLAFLAPLGCGNDRNIPQNLSATNSRERLAALEISKRPDAVDAMVQIMNDDPDPSIREDATRSLGRRGDKRATTALVAKSGSGDILVVRAAALNSLGRLGDPNAVPGLIDLWRRDDAVRDDGVLQIGAAEALAKIGAPAIPSLVQALADPSWNVRYYAVKTLKAIGDRSVVDQIKPLLFDPNAMVRTASAQALEALK